MFGESEAWDVLHFYRVCVVCFEDFWDGDDLSCFGEELGFGFCSLSSDFSV